MKKTILSLVLLLAVAQAQANAGSKSTEFVIGQSKHDHDFSIRGNVAVAPFMVIHDKEDLTDTSITIRQTFGLTDYLAFEIGLHDLGTSTSSGVYYNSEVGAYSSDATLDMLAISIGMKSGYDFSFGLSLYARFGAAAWKMKVKRVQFAYNYDNHFVDSDSDIGVDPYIGIDIRYALTDFISLGIQHTVYEVGSEIKLNTIKFEGDSTIKETALSIGFHY